MTISSDGEAVLSYHVPMKYWTKAAAVQLKMKREATTRVAASLFV
jgi:hypothetical protein